MQKNAKNIYRNAKMNIFYHNYNGRLQNPAVPEVVRARDLALRGVRRAASFKIKPGCFLAVSSNPASEKWRFAGEEKWHGYPPGKICLFKPGADLEFMQIPGVDRRGIMLQFVRGEVLGVDQLFPDGVCFLEIEDRENRFGRIIQSIAALPAEAYYEAQSGLFQFIAQLHHRMRQQQAEETGFADNVDLFLRKNADHLLTRNELAKQMNISVSLLSHRYRKERGIPVMQRHLEIRLEQARTMLLNGNTIAEIAMSLGFSSPFHLSRAFKKHFRETPSQLKKRQ